MGRVFDRCGFRGSIYLFSFASSDENFHLFLAKGYHVHVLIFIRRHDKGFVLHDTDASWIFLLYEELAYTTRGWERINAGRFLGFLGSWVLCVSW